MIIINENIGLWNHFSRIIKIIKFAELTVNTQKETLEIINSIDKLNFGTDERYVRCFLC